MDASTHLMGYLGASRVQGVVNVEPDDDTVILCICQMIIQPVAITYSCPPMGIASDMIMV